ncbi:hypothetical protein DM50_3366 [Burkholderia mallei]|nr:hypothetical protein DM50_3366 [Burkholderia mallei]
MNGNGRVMSASAYVGASRVGPNSHACTRSFARDTFSRKSSTDASSRSVQPVSIARPPSVSMRLPNRRRDGSASDLRTSISSDARSIRAMSFSRFFLSFSDMMSDSF